MAAESLDVSKERRRDELSDLDSEEEEEVLTRQPASFLLNSLATGRLNPWAGPPCPDLKFSTITLAILRKHHLVRLFEGVHLLDSSDTAIVWLSSILLCWMSCSSKVKLWLDESLIPRLPGESKVHEASSARPLPCPYDRVFGHASRRSSTAVALHVDPKHETCTH